MSTELLLLTFIGSLAGGIWVRRFITLSKVKKKYRHFHKNQIEVMDHLEQRREKSLASLENELRQSKQALERDLRHKNQELKQLENKIQTKEKSLDEKKEKIQALLEEVKKNEEALHAEELKFTEISKELDQLKEEEEKKLEAQANVSGEQLKEEMLKQLHQQIQGELRRYQETVKKEMPQKAEKDAQKILELVIQRMDLSHFSDGGTVSVAIPSDEMKGRVIGKEGRNIQTLELLIGAEFILDQTPGQIVIQSTDPIRREIGKRVLEQLIQEGRINPIRIEEVVRKTKAEVDEMIQEAGEEAIRELDVHEVHPDLIRLLGRLKYAHSLGQNVLQHLKETAYLAEMMAAELGLDARLAKRMGLFHDIGKSIAKDLSAEHDAVGVEITKRYGEDPLLINAVGAHHDRLKSESPLAEITNASNKISGSRPGARSEKIQSLMNRVETVEKIANSFKGVERSYCVQNGRELRVFVDFKKVNESQAADLARQISKKIKDHKDISGEIKVVLIRESRIVEIAK